VGTIRVTSSYRVEEVDLPGRRAFWMSGRSRR